MSRRRLRSLGYALIGLVVGIALIIAILFVLTRTDFGIERVRRVAVSQLQKRLGGDVKIGRIDTEPGLLGGATLEEVEIGDEEGRPFLRADSVRLGYSLRTLLSGRIELDRAEIYGAEVTIERLPGDTVWSYERFFPETDPDDEVDRLIQIRRARIVDGSFVIRYPWEPDGPVEPDDTARLILREAPGGLQREIRFEEIDAELPRILWESPDEDGRLFQIADLSMLGYIWKDPFDLRELKGAVTQRDSVIAFEADHLELPNSTASGAGMITMGEDRTRIDIDIEAENVATRDLQWLYPPFPDEGGGSLDFRIQTQPDGTLWLARNAQISVPGSELAGSFGIVTGDTLYFTEVDLEASPLDVALLEQILPIDLPIDGLLIGTVEIDGPISSLSTRGDLRLAAADGSRPTARWVGTVDLRPPYAAQNLRAEIAGLDLAKMLGPWITLPESGTLSGRVTATGRLDESLRLAGRIRHELEGLEPSYFEGSGRLALNGRGSTIEAEIQTEHLALETLATLIPGVGELSGSVHGPIRVTGPLADLEIDADLMTAVGKVRFEAHADVASTIPSYHASGQITDLRLSDLLPLGQETVLDTRFSLTGHGRDPDSVHADLRLELESGRVGNLVLHDGRVKLGLHEGLIHVDTLDLGLDAGRVGAWGTIGLRAGRSGTLSVEVQADSLDVLRDHAFPEVAHASNGSEAEDKRYRLEGRGRVSAQLEGSIREFVVNGEASLHDFIYDRSSAQRMGLTFTASDLATEAPQYRVHATADSLTVFGQHIGGATATLDFGDGEGAMTVEAWASLPESSEYRVVTTYRRAETGVDLNVTDLRVRTGAERWELDHPTRASIGRDGVVIHDLALVREDAEGSVHAAGRIPWRQDELIDDAVGSGPKATFEIDVDALPIFALRGGPDLEPAAIALLSGRLAVTGSASAPQVAAAFEVADLRIGDVRLDQLDVAVTYDDQRAETQIRAWRDGERVLTGGGTIPLDLRLAPILERRLDETLDVELRASGMPATILTSLIDGFHDVVGTLDGVVVLGGTTLEPDLGGELELERGGATWALSGVRYRDLNATFRVLSEQVVAVDATTRAGHGHATISGAITFQPLTDPRFQLRIVAREFEAARRRDVEAVGTGEVHLSGRFTEPVLEGELRIDRGALHVDEVMRQHQVVALDDDFILASVDTTAGALKRIRPYLTSPFLKNLEIRDGKLKIDRDMWLRGRNLNMEVAGSIQVELDMRREDLRLTGSLEAVRGFYELYLAEAMPVRRFALRSGTVDFDGTPGINPELNITTAYRVRTPRSEPLDVMAIVSGTLQSPRVSLQSAVEPPISESDLMSYVVFGRPTYELAGPESQQLGTALALTNLGFGVLERSVLGYAAAGLESVVSNLGILDYVAITEWEGGTAADEGATYNLFARSQVEVGRYLGEAWYIALTRRFVDRGVGGKLEWRFLPTWTAELFYEDRYARFAPYGLEQTIGEGDKVGGFFLFREWGF